MPAHDNKQDHARSPTPRRGGDADDTASPGSLGGQATSFLALIRPYRELAALVIGVVAAGLAAYTWTVSYFATRSQLTTLNCEMASRIDDSAVFTRQAILGADEAAKTQRLAALNADPTRTADQKMAKVVELSAEIQSDEAQERAATNQLVSQGTNATCH